MNNKSIKNVNMIENKIKNKKSFLNNLFNYNIKQGVAIKNKKVINKKKKKQELKELFNGFNKINGYIPDFNIIINELNDYIAIVECLDYSSVKKLINDMTKYNIREIQIFSHHRRYYCSLRFINSFKNVIKNKYIKKEIAEQQEQELLNINNTLLQLSKKDAEFIVLSLIDVFKILREKVFRTEDLSEDKIKRFIYNDKKNKVEFQNNIFAKNINIDNDYIIFNYNNKIEENKTIYHKVYGLQLYPSYLYEGYLTEINYLSGVQTCTYIKNVNKDKIINNIAEASEGQLLVIKDYLNNVDNLYLTCFFIHIYGNKEKVDDIKKKVDRISNKYNIHLNEFNRQQKRAYDAFLPLMNNKIKCYRQIDNINGILPQNDELISYFKCNFKYGKELNTNNDFYFKRKFNGIVLSSNLKSKNDFLDKEKEFLVNEKELEVQNYSFKLEDLKNKYKEKTNIYKKFLNYDFKISVLNEYQLYILFKMWLNLCLSFDDNKNYVDTNDKENLDAAFELLEKTFLFKNNVKLTNMNEILNSMKENNIVYISTASHKSFIERILNYLNIHNNKLYKKIYKQYINPSEEIKLYLTGLYDVLLTTSSLYIKNDNYIYLNNIEEIVYCLDTLFNYIFTNTFKNKYMFTSNNDFVLLNNIYVAKEMFKAPYINIVDVISSDLVKINDFVYLSNNDIAHLNNKINITGRLITKICEFNYYIKKENEESEI